MTTRHMNLPAVPDSVFRPALLDLIDDHPAETPCPTCAPTCLDRGVMRWRPGDPVYTPSAFPAGPHRAERTR